MFKWQRRNLAHQARSWKVGSCLSNLWESEFEFSHSFLSIWVSLKEQDYTWAHMLLLHTAYRKVPDTHIKRLDVGYHETSRSIYCNLSATCRDVPRCATMATQWLPKTSGCWLPHWDVVAAIDRVVWRVRVRWPHIRMQTSPLWFEKKKTFLWEGTGLNFVTWRIGPWLVSNSRDAAKTHLSDLDCTGLYRLAYARLQKTQYKHVTCTNTMQHLLSRKHATSVLLLVAVLWFALHTTRPIRSPFATLKPLRSGPKFAVDFGIVIQRQTYRLKTNETGAAGTAWHSPFKRFPNGCRGGNSADPAVLQHEGRHSDFAAVLLQGMFLIRLIRLIRPIPKNARLSKSDEKCANSLPTNVQSIWSACYSCYCMKCETLHLELLLQRQDLSHVDLLMVSWSFKLKHVQSVFSVSSFN